MNEPNDNPPPRRYTWPWWVLAGFVLFVALAVLWMSFKVRQIEHERRTAAPVPTNSAR